MAPSYDLLNIGIYGYEFERDLAMAVGDEFVAEKVMPYDLAEFCDASNLPFRQVVTSLKNLCTATIGRMGSLPLGDVRTGEEMDFAQDLIEKVKGTAERLLVIAGELPLVRL
ncbi:MAG: hypothetical protein PHI97_22300 [Desulfobulbus sp.]|nr:hypothetical protein [Desulfobulbus sp.]